MFKFLAKSLAAIGGVVVSIAICVFLAVGPLPWNNISASFADIDQHFRYGSIGGEATNGLPYWIWKVLPTMFADKLSVPDYTAFGFMQEPGMELPVGFAKSKSQGIEVITQNCATCHVGQVRTSPEGKPELISGMPGHNVDLQGYIQFLREVANDPHFTTSQILPYIEAASGGLNPLEKLLYRFVAIPQSREALAVQGARLSFMDRQPAYGPGRIDTFTPYKTLRFNVPQEKLRDEELQGISDFPPIWQQRPRQGLKLHWDGNNDSIDERNKSAALALVQPTSINFPSLHRVRDWLLDLPAPKFPFAVDVELADKGKEVFTNSCAECHVFGGKKTGTVEAIEKIRTDPGRLNSYTKQLAANQYSLFAEISFKGEDQRFKHFRKTNGYSNLPLDGIWLRAPYLHNGSVPTLSDLLEKAPDRQKVFYRGNDLYDPDKVGFVSDQEQSGTHHYFKYDTSLPGNSNSGHDYGTDLPAEKKLALIEYLKQL